MYTVDDGVRELRYAVTVGARLRAIRAQQGLSLHDVEARSDEEFKASVLGAYERGERAISVARLQRLASFYAVPVDQLLPVEDGPGFGRRPGYEAPGSETVVVGDPPFAPVRIDLAAIGHLTHPRAERLTRFLRMIQVQRGDFNGQVLTVRRDDRVALACILDVSPEAVGSCLAELGVTYKSAR